MLAAVAFNGCPELMTNTFLLISFISMVAAAITMVLVRIIRPKFGYSWLLAASGAITAWLSLLPVGRNLPSKLNLIVWEPTELFSAPIVFMADQVSWSYGLALAGLVLGVIFTDVLRAVEADWSAWAGSLMLGALGLTAVFADNPVTLMLAWAAIDAAELMILLWHIPQSSIREKVIVSFSSRVGGIFLLILAEIVARTGGNRLDFATIQGPVGNFLVLACALRLGVIPLHIPFLQEPPIRRSLGTTIRLVPVASSLVLLTRTASAATATSGNYILLVLSVFAALFGSISWALAKDELDGRPYWIISVVSIALFSALRGDGTASLAWGIASILTGGLLFISSARHRYLFPLTALGLLGILPVPLTPGWAGIKLYAPPYSVWLGAIVVTQSLLIIGYIRHLAQPGEGLVGVERWVWVIYPAGLIIILAGYGVITWWGLTEGVLLTGLYLIPNIVAGILCIGFCGIWVYIYRRGFSIPDRMVELIRKVFSLGWLYRFLWEVFQTLRRLVNTLTFVLEGQGGILWALVLLLLLLALLQQG